MRLLLINSVCDLSTGKICGEIAREYEEKGYEVKIAYGRDGRVPEGYKKYVVRIGSDMDVRLHGIQSRLLDAHGLGSVRATRRFLKWAENFKPDLLWLHNLHGYYLNYELLFQWIKSHPEMEVRWTLHDCWAFTGHCSYFTMANCDQWKSHCSHCPQKRRYPASLLLDRCRRNFDRKRAAFTGVKKMTLITPSQWLKDLVGQSFLRDYPVEVRHNTIDTQVFKPTPSDFRARYGLEGKIVILGVASVWDERKGLDDFVRLAGMLDDRYAIVLVGLTKRQIKQMPRRIVAIERTQNQGELAGIYTAADVFVNPSREETFGMTTIEAEACGTDAIVYEDTACEEIVKAYKGQAVPQGVENVYKLLTRGGTKQRRLMTLILRTNNGRELAAIYTAADVFVNPTYEDNYPTVNIEARACGTPVITYRTGGSPESAEAKYVVEVGDVPGMASLIEQICTQRECC